MMEKNYVPFGDEWKKEMKRHSKDQLIEWLKDAYLMEHQLRQKIIESASQDQ
jgi:ferritin-like metal-binding protein YciE